jgi:hypothetical protein
MFNLINFFFKLRKFYLNFKTPNRGAATGVCTHGKRNAVSMAPKCKHSKEFSFDLNDAVGPVTWVRVMCARMLGIRERESIVNFTPDLVR